MAAPGRLSDHIVAAAANGSRPDLDRIARSLAPQVRLMVLVRLAARPQQCHAVEEIAQATMVGLVDGLPRLQNRTVAGLKSFVSRIVANGVAAFLKTGGGKAKRESRALSLDSVEDDHAGGGALWQFLSASGTSPPSAVAKAEQVTRLLTELSHLRAQDREIIAFGFFDQLPTSEIAERLQISRAAASMRLIRAVKMLRRNVTGSSKIKDRNAD